MTEIELATMEQIMVASLEAGRTVALTEWVCHVLTTRLVKSSLSPAGKLHPHVGCSHISGHLRRSCAGNGS